MAEIEIYYVKREDKLKGPIQNVGVLGYMKIWQNLNEEEITKIPNHSSETLENAENRVKEVF